jgi:butyryl-CoA dehydrogenase
MIIEVFAMESAILRADKIAAGQGIEASAIPVAMARIYADKAMSSIELSARKVIAAVAEGDMLRTQLTILRRLAKHDSVDTISLRRQVAGQVIRAGRYSF